MPTQKEVRVENSKDLLLLLLYTPGTTGGVNEPIRGKTRLTKLMFLFLTEYYKKFDFDKKIKHAPEFIPYKYGPFSKDVFEDLEFFENIGFVETTPEVVPEISGAEIEELTRFNEEITIGSASYESSSYEYEEEIYRLTGRGCEYAERLFSDLSKKQKDALVQLKKKYGSVPLYALLEYVYNTYPDFAVKSEIRDRYLY